MSSIVAPNESRRNQEAYAIGCGLRNAVFHRSSRDWGRVAENAVFLWLRSQGLFPTYRRNGVGVDFMVEIQGRSVVIDVSRTDSLSDRKLPGLEKPCRHSTLPTG